MSRALSTGGQKTQNDIRHVVKQRLDKALDHFDDVVVYSTGQAMGLMGGFARLWSIVLFPAFGAQPFLAELENGSHSVLLWVPIGIAVCVANWAMVAIATAPWVSNIRLKVPKQARRSQEALLTYIQHLPDSAKVSIQHTRWSPWPRRDTYELGALQKRAKNDHSFVVNRSQDTAVRDGTSSHMRSGLGRWLYTRLHQQYDIESSYWRKQSSKVDQRLFNAFWARVPPDPNMKQQARVSSTTVPSSSDEPIGTVLVKVQKGQRGVPPKPKEVRSSPKPSVLAGANGARAMQDDRSGRSRSMLASRVGKATVRPALTPTKAKR